MQTLETLTRRQATLGSIHGVVRTMKTLSAVNAAPYTHAAEAISVWHDTVLDGLQALLAAIGASPTADAALAPTGAGLALVFGSDHGLCGGFNRVIAEFAQTLIAPGTRVLAVGAQAEAALDGLGLHAVQTFMPPSSVDGIGRLAGQILLALDGLRAGSGGRGITVTLYHSRHDAARQQQPTATLLLPLTPAFLADLAARPWPSRSRPMAGIAPGPLFESLLRNHIFATVFRAAAESMAAENAERFALMQQAEHAIDDRLDALGQTVRSARQTAITDELLDVVAGFEALRHRRIDHSG